MENNNEAMESENFYYEDIVDGVNRLLTKETLAVYSEAGISKKEILDIVEENLPPIYDKETLDAYCKRFLQFVLIEQLNNNFAENIDQKARLNRVAGDIGEKPHIDPEVLKKYLDAYESGDYAGVYNTVSTASAIFTMIGRNKAKPHYMDRTQLKVYQKYINDYRKKLLSEFSKISIPQPKYEVEETAEQEFETEVDDFAVDNVIEKVEELDDEIPGFDNTEETSEIEENDLPSLDEEETDDEFSGLEDEKYELEKDEEEYTVEDEEESVFDDFDNGELSEIDDKNEIDTNSILASIDELEDVLPPQNKDDDEDELEDELPGFDDEDELEDELPGFDDEEELDDELPGLDDIEETAEVEENDLPSFDDEDELEDELPGFDDEEETAEIEENDLPSFDDEEELDDELPGFEDEEETAEVEENDLPSFDDEEELDDELPGFDDEEEIAEVEENDLPSFDDEDELDDELPGLDDIEETAEVEENDLPSFDDEEELEDDEEDKTAQNELESLEEELSEIDDNLSNFELDNSKEDVSETIDEETISENDLPSFEEDINEFEESKKSDELLDLEESDEISTSEDEFFSDENKLPNLEDNSLDELPGLEVEEENTLEEENPKIIDERRNYDLVFEDNYYEIPEVSTEYIEAHPNYEDAKFVEATGGTNLDDFISTMLYLKDNEKTEVVGIFNNVALYTHELNTVDEIEAVYDKLVDEIDEDDINRKTKSDCISYDEYYNQYIQKDISREAVKYQHEHKEIKMILIPQTNVTLSEFAEAVWYFIQDDMSGTALKYNNISIIASDYSSKEEIIKALSREDISDTITKEEPKENVEEAEIIEEIEELEDEVFDKSPEYYKSIAKISKNKTDAYRQKHPECKKVMIVVERDSQIPVDFFEAVRYYNSINKNIIAQYNGIQLIARKYNSAKEMIEAYEIKKSKKAK